MLKRFLVVLILLAPLGAQVCRLSVAGLNRNRRVVGEITAECPSPIHSAPFGNWGATSNFGSKRDGHQFDGWCHDQRVCDNSGNCKQDCVDGWYEWNSCTNHALYRAPNSTLFNSTNGTEQVTTTGVNVLGTQTVDIPVSCPSSSSPAAGFDRGGCSEVRTYSRDNNFMSLYELDPLTGDELVQSVYFPGTTVNTHCNVWGCDSSTSDYVQPISWDSPKEPAKVFAEMAMIVNSGTFVDSGNRCQITPVALRTVSSATLQGSSLAPDSLGTLFATGVAGSTETATTSPLPTTLAGIQVRLTDRANVSHLAPISYVSPSQINFVAPAQLREGEATVSVVGGNAVRASGAVTVSRVQPGIFSADGTGKGTAAAVAIHINAQGVQTTSPAYSCGDIYCTPMPIDPGSSQEQLVLVLFGTGIRGGQTTEATLGGVPAQVLFAGAQPTYAGLDQVNMLVPKSLAGAGILEVMLTVDGKAANPLIVWFR